MPWSAGQLQCGNKVQLVSIIPNSILSAPMCMNNNEFSTDFIVGDMGGYTGLVCHTLPSRGVYLNLIMDNELRCNLPALLVYPNIRIFLLW